MKANELANALKDITRSVYDTDVGPFSEGPFQRFADDRAYAWFEDVLESANGNTVEWLLNILPPLDEYLEQQPSLEGFDSQPFIDASIQYPDENLLRWLSVRSFYLNKALQKRPSNDDQLFLEAQRFAIEDCFINVIDCLEPLLIEAKPAMPDMGLIRL